VQVLADHTDIIYAVCFSPDGKQLATGSSDMSIKLYSFNEGSAILAHTLEGHTDSVKSLSFSPDCKLLCSGSKDESIKFWNPADGSLVKSIKPANYDRGMSVSYSPNGRILVSSSWDNTMKIWDAETFELKHTFEQEFDTNQLTITASACTTAVTTSHP
jgi:WD40 repeat protein